MAPEWLFLFSVIAIFSAVGSILVAVVWLRKLRETVSASFSEMVGQQVLAAQRASETIAQLQKQQDCCAQQIQTLAQAGLRLQQEISTVANRLENAQKENPRGGHTLH